MFTTLETRTNEDEALGFAKIRDTYYGNFDFTNNIKAFFMIVDAMIHDNPPNGFVIVFDMKGVGFMHLTRLPPSALLAFFKYIQEGLPTRLSAIHVLNSNYLVSALMKLITPFMNEAFKHKLHFHPPSLDMDYFYEHCVSKCVMPYEYGGNLPSIEILASRNLEKLVEMKQHFEAEEMQRRDFIQQNH